LLRAPSVPVPHHDPGHRARGQAESKHPARVDGAERPALGVASGLLSRVFEAFVRN